MVPLQGADSLAPLGMFYEYTYIYIFVYIYICIFPYIPYFFEGLRQISISRFPGPKQRWRVARGSSTSAAHADALPEMARASGLVWVDNEKSYLYAPRDWNIYLFLAYIYVEIIGKCTIVPYMEHLGYIDRLELSKRHFIYIYICCSLLFDVFDLTYILDLHIPSLETKHL